MLLLGKAASTAANLSARIIAFFIAAALWGYTRLTLRGLGARDCLVVEFNLENQAQTASVAAFDKGMGDALLGFEE